MGKFAYRVKDKNEDILEGMLEAPNEELAQKFLGDRHYSILSLQKIKEQRSLKEFMLHFERVQPVHFNFFVRQMATLLKAGVPMLPTLITLEEGTKDAVLQRVIHEIYLDIEKGTSFSQSVTKHPKIFSPLFVASVRSGEAIGELDTVLLRLSDILEKDYQTTSKMKAALRYPMFAMATMVIAFLVATLFIIPRFKSLFASFGEELPLPTRILLGTSEFIINYWYVVAALLAGAAAAFYFHYKSHKGKRFWDGILLQAPIVGLFVRNALFSRFSRMLGLMLKSGVNLLQGLGLISEIVDNSVISDSILRVKDRVAEGDAMAAQLRQEAIYPLLLCQMVHVGEESGKMDELLLQIAEFYDAELEVLTKNMESMIEPVFIVVLGVFVMIMALGIFLPMWNMFSVIQRAAA